MIAPTASGTQTQISSVPPTGLTFAELERQSGVKRQSLMKFARDEQSLRLDMVDRLLPFLGLKLTKKQKGN